MAPGARLMKQRRGGACVAYKPLRIAGLVVGGGVLALGALVWGVYVRSSLAGFGHESGPGLKTQDFVEAFFLLWLVVWSIGLCIVLIAIAGWLERTLRALLALSGAMLAVSLVTYAIGSA